MKDEVNSQPVKLVIEHIKKQIAERQILPGERLPSERKLSELLKVSRSHVREALQKMELYGIVKTYPQSGTVVSEFSKDQLDTMITDALKISRYDFSSLVYVRVLLEIEVCKLCAVNRTKTRLSNWKKSLIQTFVSKKILPFTRPLRKADIIRLSVHSCLLLLPIF